MLEMIVAQPLPEIPLVSGLPSYSGLMADMTIRPTCSALPVTKMGIGLLEVDIVVDVILGPYLSTDTKVDAGYCHGF